MKKKETVTKMDQEVINEVMKRSLNDSSFRELALANGTSVFEGIAGREVPADVEFKFIKEGDSKLTYTFVLPEFIGEGIELSKDDLEQVAGGFMSDCPNLRSCSTYDTCRAKFDAIA